MSVINDSMKDIIDQEEPTKKRHNSQMSDQPAEIEAEYNNLEKSDLIKRLKKFEEENKMLKEKLKHQELATSKTNQLDSDVNSSNTPEKRARKESAKRGKTAKRETPLKEGTLGREETPISIPLGLLYAENDTMPDTQNKIDELIRLVEDTPSKLNANITSALVENIKKSKIRELDLRKKSITNKTVIAVAKSLRDNNHLISLNLSYNFNITEVGVKEITKALKKNTKLEQLDMSNNKITDEGAGYFAELMRSKKLKLKFLHLEKNRITLEGFQKLEKNYQPSTLRYLFLIEDTAEIEEIVQRTSKKSAISENKTQAEVNDGIADEIKCIIDRVSAKISKNSGNFPGGLVQDAREVRVTSEKLGFGRFGEVYKGYFRQETVAVKVITNAATINEIEQAKNEARIMSTFDHKNIVKYKGHYESPRFSIVMEYTPLGSLRDCIEKHEDLVNLNMNRIALGLARGLRYMHTYENKRSVAVGQNMIGTLHRDLKAKNALLFLKNENRVCAKLSDFGLSKIANKVSHSVPHSLRGKGGSGFHRAPEIRGGKDLNGVLLPAHHTTFEADVYSYGTILFELTSHPRPVPERIDENTCPPSSTISKLMIDCCKLNPQLRLRLDNVIEILENLKTKTVDKKADGDVPPLKEARTPESADILAKAKVEAQADNGSSLPSYTAVEALRRKAEGEVGFVKAKMEAPLGSPDGSSLLSYTAVIGEEALRKNAQGDVIPRAIPDVSR